MKRVERDYSHRSLFDKLGVTAGAHVGLSGRHDETFVEELNVRLAKSASTRLLGIYDLIFVRIDRPADLRRIAAAATRLKPNGALWAFHPKGRGASPPDGQVRAAGIAAGLVDNKISAYSETHTATRYVIPLIRR
ncbi:MAG: hypothetical protein WB615_16520 [Candidatus Tumulicola sp.]